MYEIICKRMNETIETFQNNSKIVVDEVKKGNPPLYSLASILAKKNNFAKGSTIQVFHAMEP